MSTEHRFTPEQPPARVPAFHCGRCNDLGVWLTPRGILGECPSLQLGHADHPPLGIAGEMMLRSGRAMAQREYQITQTNDFRVARALTRFQSDRPCTRQQLIDRYFDWAGSQKLRHLHACIERLRGEWLLPIGSRKSEPYGYWFITDEADFKRWVAAYKSAPIRQLSTAHAVAKAFFPEVAVQLAFEFAEVSAA